MLGDHKKTTYEREDVKRALVDLVATIGDDTDNNFLPTVRSPLFGLCPTAEVGDVLDHAMVTM